MGKALHDYFYISKDGTFKLYSGDDAPFLVEGANNHISEGKGRPAIQVALDQFIYECLNEYFENGASEYLLRKLNSNLASIRNQCLLERVNRRLVAVHVAHLPHNPPPKVFAAYMFSNIAALGGLAGLRRCQSPDCRLFFLGRPNTKWCSKTCGSRTRVKKMRRRRRE